jgi:hypothetical protein
MAISKRTSGSAKSKPNICQSVLGVKEEKQDDYGLVPGGYIHYVLWNKLPGTRLNDAKFWSLHNSERDLIRKAFIHAYE